MAFDEKTRSINIRSNDTEDDLLKDVFAYFAHVEHQMAKDFPDKFKSSKPSIKDRLKHPNQLVKACVVGMVLWTVFVFYRTSDYHELLGVYLKRWDEDSFFMNWLGVPVVVLALVYAFKWIVGERMPIKKVALPSSSPLNDFQKELATWEAGDAKVALLLIKAALLGDRQSIDRLSGKLTVEQFNKTIQVVKQMRGDA